MFAGISFAWKPNAKLISVGYNPIIRMPIRLMLQIFGLTTQKKISDPGKLL